MTLLTFGIYYMFFIFIIYLAVFNADGRTKSARTSRWGINDKTKNYWESPGGNEKKALDKLGVLAQDFDLATVMWEAWYTAINGSCATTSPEKEKQNKKQNRKQN